MKQQNNNNDEKPPTILTETIRNVKYEYYFLKTVHSLEELDDFRFKNNCKFGNAKRKNNFTRATLNCTNRNKAGGMCPFSLMARRPHPESSDIHVYAYSEHNHPLKPEAERAAHRLLKCGLAPDAKPPASFTAANGRQWTLLRTVKNQKKADKFRLKHHCKSQTGGYKYNRTTMQCINWRKCQLRLLALKTERGRFHMYGHGRHICRHANDKNEAATCTNATKKKKRKMEEQLEQSANGENACPLSTSEEGIARKSTELNAALVRAGNNRSRQIASS